MSGIPYIIEPGPNQSERVYDLYSRLLKDRIVFIRDTVDHGLADAVVAQLLFLESQNAESPIYMYINSPGGYLSAMYAIFDTMTHVTAEIITIGYGRCASAASFLLAAGAPGKRSALPNTEIMIHELSGGTQGRFNDMLVDLRHSEALYKKMAEQYHEFIGGRHSVKKIKKDMERDFWMSAEEAMDYGLIDVVQGKKEK